MSAGTMLDTALGMGRRMVLVNDVLATVAPDAIG
jgi:hypothetical protein